MIFTLVFVPNDALELNSLRDVTSPPRIPLKSHSVARFWPNGKILLK